jgi:hypothetical protein
VFVRVNVGVGGGGDSTGVKVGVGVMVNVGVEVFVCVKVGVGGGGVDSAAGSTPDSLIPSGDPNVMAVTKWLHVQTATPTARIRDFSIWRNYRSRDRPRQDLSPTIDTPFKVR